MFTPWGASQQQTTLAPGITLVSTAGHGGVHLTPELNVKVHEAWRSDNGWYEEDCEWAIVGMTFPEAFTFTDKDAETEAREVARQWFPDKYEQVTGETVTPEQSYVRAEQVFHTEHANDWVTVSAYGDWADWVPEGRVGVVARIGGRQVGHGEPTPTERRFWVDKAEYDTRGAHGFVIDLERHIDVTDVVFASDNEEGDE